VTVSIGISIYPDDGSDIIVLLKCADVAMYRCKKHGRNNYQFYSLLRPAAEQSDTRFQSQLSRPIQ
jgi:predicted signal transduction protein with EAL and GGDEF domain